MKKISALLTAVAMVAAFAASALAAVPADTLEEVKKKGVLVAGVKDSLPPFGYVDEKSREIVGYDIDFVKAIAKKLGVKVELKAVTSANRMPMLQEANIDLIAATMTKNPERAKQIDFSYTYFITGQKFLVNKKGKVKKIEDLQKKGLKIGTAKGSTSEQNAKKALPDSEVLSFDDYPAAVLALQQGKVVAVTTDESLLLGQLAKLNTEKATKGKYEITTFAISVEPYGIGMRKGDEKFVKFVQDTVLEMEKTGEAQKIFDKWLGAKTEYKLKRSFKITADKLGIE